MPVDPKDPRVLAEIDRVLRDMMAKAEVDDVDLPHSVVLHDPFTGLYTVTGPYENAYIAAQESVRIKDEANAGNDVPGEPEMVTYIAQHFGLEDDSETSGE